MTDAGIVDLGLRSPLDKATEISVNASGPVGIVRFNRPDRRNALTPAMRGGLLDALDEFEERSEIRCVVITGSGSAFCAGGDVAAQSDRAQGSPTSSRFYNEYLAMPGRCARRLLEFRKPTLAALPGPAAGAGVSIALLCDVRIASTGAFLKIPFLDRGLVPDWLLLRVLPHYVGLGVAMDLFFTQARVDAEQAVQLGLFSAVVEEQDFDRRVAEAAARLAMLPPVAASLTKTIVKADLGDMSLAVHLEALAQAVCAVTQDHREGAAAFLEKRPPRFEGK